MFRERGAVSAGATARMAGARSGALSRVGPRHATPSATSAHHATLTRITTTAPSRRPSPAPPWTRQQRSPIRGANSRPRARCNRAASGRVPRSAVDLGGEPGPHPEEEYPMPAVSIERFLKELEKLKRDMDGGKLKSGAYDQRLARVIQELRERGVDADRTQITAALVDAHQRGVITDSVKGHLEKRLGLV